MTWTSRLTEAHEKKRVVYESRGQDFETVVRKYNIDVLDGFAQNWINCHTKFGAFRSGSVKVDT